MLQGGRCAEAVTGWRSENVFKEDTYNISAGSSTVRKCAEGLSLRRDQELGTILRLFNTCLNRTEMCRWDLPQVKVHYCFLGEDSLVQAPGLKSPAYSSLSH